MSYAPLGAYLLRLELFVCLFVYFLTHCFLTVSYLPPGPLRLISCLDQAPELVGQLSLSCSSLRLHLPGQAYSSPAATLPPTPRARLGLRFPHDQESLCDAILPTGSEVPYGTQGRLLHEYHFMLPHSNSVKQGSLFSLSDEGKRLK